MDWEDVIKGTVFVFVVAFIASIFLFAFSSKQHKGYYLCNMFGESKIYINWENYPDEVAFRTFNEKEALDTLERLNK